MENYTCQNCGKKIPECNRTLHGLSCKNTITHDEFQDLIPCEYCNHLISFGEYNNHIQHCDAQMSFVLRFSSLLTTPLLTPGHFTSDLIPLLKTLSKKKLFPLHLLFIHRYYHLHHYYLRHHFYLHLRHQNLMNMIFSLP